jgi:indole-3-acetate monooxygenase
MTIEDSRWTETAEPRQLPEQLRSAIEAAREESDHLADSPSWLTMQLRDAGALRLLTPHELGGYETPLVIALDIYEGFGRIDASAGWLVWNANFGFLAAYLEPSGVERLWADGHEPLFANSGMPGEAEEAQGGYRVSGHWKIVSGIHAAHWLVVVGIVTRGSHHALTESGAPDIRVCVLHRDQIHIEDTWYVSGMRATGSNDVVADQVFVPADLTIALTQQPRLDRPLYRGFLPALAIPGCTAVGIGVARSAIDEVVKLAATKPTMTGGVLAESPHAQYAIAKSESDVLAARLLLHQAARSLQTASECNQAVTIRQRAALRAAMTHAAQVSRQTLVTMYELASSSSLYRGNPLERIFRDGMAALQHANHSAPFLEAAGRVRLGLPDGMPLF